MTTLTLHGLFELTPWAYLIAFALSQLLRNDKRVWACAHLASLAGVAIASFSFVAGLASHLLQNRSADLIGQTMMMLIVALGWIVTTFSRRYLAGDPGQRHYVASLMLTLAAVSTVAMAQNLGLLAAAWVASSLSLHQLLIFYPERVPAQIAAHKKFISSRIAEICLLVAVVIIYQQSGSLTPAAIAAHIDQANGMPMPLEIAFVFIALAVILKSAQLPIHGWLIQVMEAPTPVSALLHAGIVNLGGFVLIRLAEPMDQAGIARGLLVFVGASTALLAGLVMMTRISIKVRLAWSTCAQMGFMLMECGLGLYDLALLHLVAHSLYKAYAFLSAGDAVVDARYRMMLTPPGNRATRENIIYMLCPVPACIALILISLQAWQLMVPGLDLHPTALLIAGLGLSPLLWPHGTFSGAILFKAVLRIAGIIQLYLLWHWAFTGLAPASHVQTALLPSLWAVACLCALYLAQVWLKLYPSGVFSRRLYPWAYGGFFLDERMTRLTFRLWPPPKRPHEPRSRKPTLMPTVSGELA